MKERIIQILVPLEGEKAASKIADLVEKFVNGLYPPESGLRLLSTLKAKHSITGEDAAFLDSVAASIPQRM